MYIPEGVSKCKDGVADKLQLRFELGVLCREPLPSCARLLVVAVVGRGQATGITALEVVLPEFCKDKGEREVNTLVLISFFIRMTSYISFLEFMRSANNTSPGTAAYQL